MKPHDKASFYLNARRGIGGPKRSFTTVLIFTWIVFIFLLWFFRTNSTYDALSSESSVNLEGLEHCLRFISKDCFMGITNNSISLDSTKRNLPCKHEILRELTYDINQALKRLSTIDRMISYYFVYGSSLGLQRHHDVCKLIIMCYFIICWEY
jgi:hypothetical protein